MAFSVSATISEHKNSGKLNTENSGNNKSIWDFSKWTKGFGNLIALT